MSALSKTRPVIALAFLGASFLGGEEPAKLTARQLYNFRPATPPAKAPATAAVTPDPSNAGPAKATTKPPAATHPSNPPANPPKTTTAAKTPEPEAQYLGMKYTLLDGKTMRPIADPKETFHSGDRIRLQVESNTSGYLYVLNRDPKGQWDLLYPSAEVVHNNNWIDRDTPKEVPQGQNFVFDNEAGDETIFTVLSKQREPEVEKLIQIVRGNRSNMPRSAPALAVNRAPSEAELLSNGMKSRALKVEPAGKDVYVVVNDPGERRIVTEIVLKHK